jgi:hypothetical protein
VIFLYIFLGLVAVTLIGKLVTRSNDKRRNGIGPAFSMNQRIMGINPGLTDPIENPRQVDDGTNYGYREFD